MNDDEWMRGAQWTAEHLERLQLQSQPPRPFQYNSVMTGRMTSAAQVQPSTLRKPVIALDAIDIELLNPLNHPTRFQADVERREALKRFVYHAARGMQEKLAGDEVRGMHHINVAERYRTKYQFTQEETDGSI